MTSAEVVRELARRFQAGDRDGARALMHPDIRVEQPASLPHGGEHHGHTGLDRMGAAFAEHWDRTITDPRVFDADPLAVQVTTQTWTARTTGRTATVDVVELISVADGLVTEIRVFPQDPAAAQPAGVLTSRPPLSTSVLEAFGCSGPIRLVPGGQGRTLLSDDVALKPADCPEETAWAQELLDLMEPDGFRIATPLRARSGAWVHEGWAAHRFVSGLRPLATAWDDVIAAGLAFGDAATRAWRAHGASELPARSHRWATADRVAWDEVSLAAPPEVAELCERLRASCGPIDGRREVVHGDLSGNVFVAADGVPVVLDFSPYLRPRSWAAAIVTADAVLWHGAPPALVSAFAHSESGRRDLAARALLFRLVADLLAPGGDGGGYLGRYTGAVGALR